MPSKEDSGDHVLKAWQAAKNALENVLEAVTGESIAIICDEEKRDVGDAFAEGALKSGLWTRLILLKSNEEVRTETPAHLLEVLTTQKPDLYVNLMRGLRQETPFRIDVIKLETRDRQARLGHCPGVTIDMLTDGALAFTSEEHRRMQSFASKLMRVLEGTEKIELRSQSGTHITLTTGERPFFTDTKFDWKTRNWMNLPTGEVIVAPAENSLSGRLVCDVAIGGIGLLKTPIEIVANNGKVEKIASKDKTVLRGAKETLATDEWSDIVGEFAFGINPKARFAQEFLEAEKVLGTVHIAFGNNLDMPGGKNPSKNHMDFLMSKPTVKAFKEDEKAITVFGEWNFKV